MTSRSRRCSQPVRHHQERRGVEHGKSLSHGSGFTLAALDPLLEHYGNEIWFMSQDNGLQIVRFTDRFRATRKDLFGSR